ncbi:L-threonine ammonia-lyase [Halolactibacillus halophilus]|uniref:L-threonine dehydratase n=1 Tax=Halolactibacillus halophilus TaxID=306540 RepID=A0A1I5NF82_9BACI|nr:threonine ammonia-lyase IlvA [Halolactibacillus halophilus]GEM01301.1 L-threonine dehydratase biosynthetic IlvA [Halolactibacillus halophilus]SFP20387.1 L-threonine ammonia-lyase [Halolactibacillus halophilus]
MPTEKPIDVKDIIIAHQRIKDVVTKTPLLLDPILSEKYDCNVYLKREDLQVVRSFKIRGAYNFMQSLSEDDLKNGVVCASAGNHAQGVAFSCKAMNIKGTIFMPTTTPRQKVDRVQFFGGDAVDVILTGDTFDDASDESKQFCEDNDMTFIHPFDDERTIAGQGTIGLEILEAINEPVSHMFMSVGGGGLISGVATYVKNISPETKIIGVEPAGAASMQASFKANKVVKLDYVDKFVDGASVKRIGDITFKIAKPLVDGFATIPEGRICTTMLDLYNENAIVTEPAGAMPVSALEDYKDDIRGKNVVVIVSGGNNDIDRMQDIKERSLIYEGYKHYFIVSFPQRAGALRSFLTDVLGSDDDITRFEYTKKNNRDRGPVLVGVELKYKEDYGPLIDRMHDKGFSYIEINKDQDLFQLLI